MKKIFIAVCIIFVATTSVLGQTELFSPGWYLVKAGAQVKVVQGNSSDEQNKVDWHEISYSHNEVLLVFNFSKDKYYCHDPEGRVVIVKGQNSLQKITVNGRPVLITEDVNLGLDTKLHYGNNVWLTGFNATTKTAIILLENGQKTEIPQTSIQDLKEYFDLMDELVEWKTVE